MLDVGSLALVAAVALWGPPSLPPLPGEPAPMEPDEPTPTEPTAPSPTQPAKPKAQALTPTRPPPVADPSGPSPQRPATPTTPSDSPAVPPEAMAKSPPGTPPPEAMPEPSDSVPTAPEPPQPDVEGPPPEASSGSTQTAGSRSGPGQAPAIGASVLPGEEQERPMLRFPPPVRPPYSGTGLFIGSGIAFSASLAEQIVAHVLVKRRCIEPFGQTQQPQMVDEAEDEAKDFTDALIECAPGVLPAVALRIYSDLGLLAMIGMASAGSVLRARQRAYDDVFADRPRKPLLGLRIAGGSLLGLGVMTWLTTGAISWGLLGSCKDTKCATRARLMAFTTRDTGAVLIAAGSGMLGYALAHRRAYDQFLRERMLSVGTALLPGGAGLSLSGRF